MNSERNPSQNVGTDGPQQPSGEATSKQATKPKKNRKNRGKNKPSDAVQKQEANSASGSFELFILNDQQLS